METKPICKVQETLCINVEKVYDWILEEAAGSTTIPIARLPIPLPAGATNVEVDCTLTSADGTPLPINAKLDVTEVSPRKERQFEVNGTLVTLQRVTFTKTLYVVLEISGVDPTTGEQFLITSNPAPFTFIETAFLCAPPGTSLVVRISDFACLTVINRDETEAITGFGLSISICQSIQIVSPATIELSADFCAPREILSEKCATPTIPAQCPAVFPGIGS